jgi:peptidoglycan/LPS O-acetylase OafA/YrhL
MCTAVWFLTVGIAWRRDGRRVLGSIGIGAAMLMAVAALRNITPAVDPVSAVNNIALPVWMIAMGVAFVRDGKGSTGTTTEK